MRDGEVIETGEKDAYGHRKLGGIVHRLHEGGFAIAGAAMLQLSRQNALEFFEVYRGVVDRLVKGGL